MSDPSTPSDLYFAALHQYPNAWEADQRRERYLELMREHGYIVPVDHPDAGARDLPCGYPSHRTSPGDIVRDEVEGK